MTSVEIPNSVKDIYEYAFYECNELKEISLGSGVKMICGYSFALCRNLETVKCLAESVPDTNATTFDQSLVEYATLCVPEGSVDSYRNTSPWSSFGTIKPLTEGIMFADDAVKTLCVANWDTNNDGKLDMDEAAAVTNLGSVFKENTDITTFDELQYFTGLTSISDSAFYYCSNLSSIIIPDNVNTIGNRAFYVCSGLTSLHISANVTSIEDRAFAYCSGLESIVVDAGNTVYDSRDNCNALIKTSNNTLLIGCKNTAIPSTVKIIAEGAFRGCAELISLEIPEGVTTIGASAFRGCTGLESVTLPSTITSIGTYAFSAFDEVYNLTTVKVGMATPVSISSNVFPNRANSTLYVPEGSKVLYKAANYWKEFKEIVEMANVTEDIYYLQNVETGLFLNQGNGWGTHAVLSEYGLPLRISKQADGSYTICFMRGGGNHNILFRESSADVYVDYNGNANSCRYWTITKADNDIYRIQSLITDSLYGQSVYPGTYLGNNPNKEAYAYGHPGALLGVYNDVDGNVLSVEDMNINWRLIPVSIPIAYLVDHELPNVIATANILGVDTSDATAFSENYNASVEDVENWIATKREAIKQQMEQSSASATNPIEVTGLIQNPTFGLDGDEGWTASGAKEGGLYQQKFGESEYWNSSFNFSQTITGLANGIYQIKVKAFHRPGLDIAEVLNDYQQGIDNASAILYGNDESVILANQASAALEGPIRYSGHEANGLYVPNAMIEAKEWFDAGYYENTLTVEVTDGTLDLGIRLNEEISGQWVIFDDFKLFYLGSSMEEPNRLFAQDITARMGAQASIPVVLVNEKEFGGLQFFLTLPEGVTLSGVEKTERLDNSFQMTYEKVGDTTYQVVLFSMSRKSFLGNDGELLSLRVNLNDEMEEGEYEILLSEVVASDFDLNESALPDSRSKLTVEDFLLGDATLDGRVNVTDVMAVVNCILGHEMSVFSRKAADINADNKINITDVMGIVNIILTAGSSSN